jgi:chromosome segregation ATPase
MVVSLLLYLVINILKQTQTTQEDKSHTQTIEDLTYQVLDLKDFIYNLETRMVVFLQEEKTTQETMQETTKGEIKILAEIQKNQNIFIDKFQEIEYWQNNIMKELDKFTHIEFPKLDNIVHKHIDILRVAEQDHFNHLQSEIQNILPMKIDFKDDIEDLKQNIFSMKGLSEQIARSITKHTLQQLSNVTKDFESQVLFLKSHTEGVVTSLQEGESTLSAIRQESEMIMKQMRLSSDKMEELKIQNDAIHSSYEVIKDLIHDVELIKKEYLKSRIQLSEIVKEFKDTENEQILQMKEQIETLSALLSQKIKESLDELREYYHIADTKVPQTVQMLSQKTKLVQGYTQLNDEQHRG